MNLAFAGCLDGWVYAQMLITTTGNTGRRIIIPLKPKSKHRFRKYIIRTMELTAIGVWKSIWSVKVILTVIPPFINIWTQSLVSVRLSVQKSRDMSMETRIKYSIISWSKISQQMKSIENGARISLICSLQIMKYAITALLCSLFRRCHGLTYLYRHCLAALCRQCLCLIFSTASCCQYTA